MQMQNIHIIYTNPVHFHGKQGDFSARRGIEEIKFDTGEKIDPCDTFKRNIGGNARGEN
jgi:hypothetical protein